jgi:CHAT domain-containing protein
MSAGAPHVYELALEAGDFVHVNIRKRGVDLAVTLVDPGGADLVTRHSDRSEFSDEVVVAVAASTGRYTLHVRPVSHTPITARYTIDVRSIRPASSMDRVRVEAEAAVQRGSSLQEEDEPRSQAEARVEFSMALEGFRALGDRRRELRAVVGIVAALDRLLSPELGEMARQAELLAVEVGDDGARATALIGIGRAFERRGDLASALRFYQESVAIDRAIGVRGALSAALNDEGVVYGRTGDSERAIERFQEALTFTRATGNQRIELMVLNNLGIAYKNVGEFAKSLEFYRQVLMRYRGNGRPDRQATVLNNMGNVERLLGHDRQALTLHMEALALARQSGGKETEARSLNTIGETYAALGDYKMALQYHGESLTMRRQIGDVLGEGASLSAEGRAWLRLGDVEQALTALEGALALQRRLLDRNGEVQTLSDVATARRLQGRLPEALSSIQDAVDVEETLRRRLTSPALRSSLAAFRHDKYELLIDLLQQQHRMDPSGGHDAEALHAAERARSRALLESLLDGRVDLQQGIEPALLERERALQQQLTDASARLARAITGKAEAAEREESRRVERLTEEYQQLQMEIRRQSPGYAALTQPQALAADEIQREVVDDESVLLEFELGKEASWLWAVTPTSIQSVQLPPERDVDALARSFYRHLIARQRRTGEDRADYAKRVETADRLLAAESARLGRMLLGGIASRLAGDWRRKRLVIVPDGALEYVPFAALPLPRPAAGGALAATWRTGNLLAQSHEVVNIPSASVLAVLRRDTASRVPAPRTLAILADPVFDRTDSRVRLASRAHDASSSGVSLRRAPGAAFARLVFSREEADAIASLVMPGAAFRATDFEASRATALSGSLGQYRLVHFATHGVIDSERPALSGLVLSLVDQHGAPVDGYVRWHDIYNLKLSADLVVLSACQTALGKQVRGEGLVGLSRGFMYAGTPRVIGSLWEVSDRATAELMRVFYGGMLQRGLRPAAALRAAQLELARDPRWSSPYYWAGFVLQGEWR